MSAPARTFPVFLGLSLLGVPAALAGQEAAAPQAPQAAQAKCPVMPEEDVDPAVFVDYHGKRVFFCCVRCKAKFERDPKKYTVVLVQGQQQEPTPDRPAPAQAPTQRPKAETAEAEPRENPGAPGFLGWLGRFHPAATDFPIALLTAGAVAELLYARRKRPLLDDAARFCVWGAGITGVVTALLGWCFGGFRLVDPDRLLLIHRWLGTAAAAAMLVVLVLSERARTTPGANRGSYRAALFGTTALVLGTAFVGGAMVWGLDHYKPSW